ncbi:hypothetical protein D3C81_1794430 [compost metagenome]
MPFSKVCTWMASIGSEEPGPPIWAWPNQARSCSPPSGVGVRCQPVKVDSHLPKYSCSIRLTRRHLRRSKPG